MHSKIGHETKTIGTSGTNYIHSNFPHIEFQSLTSPHQLGVSSRNLYFFTSLQWRHNWRDSVSITSLTSVYSMVYWDADQRKHQSPTAILSENVSIWWRHHVDEPADGQHPFVGSSWRDHYSNNNCWLKTDLMVIFSYDTICA